MVAHLHFAIHLLACLFYFVDEPSDTGTKQRKTSFSKSSSTTFSKHSVGQKTSETRLVASGKYRQKGIRLTLQRQDNNDELFPLASDKLSPAWQNRLLELSLLLDGFAQRHNAPIQTLTQGKKQLELQLLIEGHTDAQPMKSARFPSNWELSTARAMTIQELLQAKLHLPARTFAIAGLGSFRPKSDMMNYADNRRIEIYIQLNLTQSAAHHDTP